MIVNVKRISLEFANYEYQIKYRKKINEFKYLIALNLNFYQLYHNLSTNNSNNPFIVVGDISHYYL